MIANQAGFLSLLDGKKQFSIPIYQRRYAWKQTQCDQLFHDILKVGGDTEQPSHFIGSIVYFQPAAAPTTSVPEFLVIDGQQRLTTVSLLLLALVHYLKESDENVLSDESWEEIQDTYLINRHKSDHSKYKLLLTRNDKEDFVGLVDELPRNSEEPSRVHENYEYFKSKLTPDNIGDVFQGIRKLIIVDVILERDKDDPQLIFESLNSTGLELSEADLIRNYILMRQPVVVQEELYEKFWFPMEKLFGDHMERLPLFFKDYLALKLGKAPKISLIYDAYKKFLKSDDGLPIREAVEELYIYARYYTRIALLGESDTELWGLFKEITRMKMEVSYPFLMSCYHDFEANNIDKEEFKQILNLARNYVFRRVICEIPTNSMDGVFMSMFRKLKPEAYLESIMANFILLDRNRRFPANDEFAEKLLVKDIYNMRQRNHFLESLENYERKEKIQADNYTIEHIMPQNENVSEAWKKDLGSDWEKIQSTYLHTIGNLTLTRYNSELSDKPYSEKCSIEGGFKKSPLFLNDTVRCEETWNEEAILRRAKVLIEHASRIWPYPNIAQERAEVYREKKKGNKTDYTLEDHKNLTGNTLELFESFKRRVWTLDDEMSMEIRKKRIGFRADSIIVDVVAQRSGLKLYLFIEFEDVIDPRGLCRDISDLGRWSAGSVEAKLQSSEDIDYIMDLVEQCYEAQIDTV